MKLQWMLMFSHTILTVMSLKFKKYPYADMTIEEKIAHDGYPLELYTVMTKDFYILTIYRIPNGQKTVNNTNKSPVLLSHGMGGTPEMFVLQGRKNALAYNLADAGFDVWLLNARGLRKSQRHKYYNLNTDRIYWNYSFHEIALYDLSANIDFIVNKTKQNIFVIGHSQGNTFLYILLAQKPEYNEKIKLGVAYAPSMKIYLNNIIITPFLYASNLLKAIFDMFQIVELIPYYHSYVFQLFRTICKEQTYFLELCFHIISIPASNPSRILEKSLIPVISGAIHTRLSMKQLFHSIQLVKTEYFGQYDHGFKKNMQIYNNSVPPKYDLRKVTAPNAIFYGEKDDLITIKGAEDTIKLIPNVVFHHKVEYEHFNHLDFLLEKMLPNWCIKKLSNFFMILMINNLILKK